MKTDPVFTMREACARAVECLARGHDAGNHTLLLPIIQALRELPLKGSPALQIVASFELLNKRKRKATGDFNIILQQAIVRVSEETIDHMKAPMDIYSDASEWWPRAKAAA